MSQNSDLPQNSRDKAAESHKNSEHGSTAASHKLYSEASNEWNKKAAEARKAPLSVQDGQNYVVKPGDTLSDIAARRLRADHEGVNSHSIAKEESRLRKLNSGEHSSLGAKDKKHRDSLNEGWHLKIYDSVHDKKGVSSAPGDTTSIPPKGKQDVATPEAAGKPQGISKEVAEKIASQLTASELEMDTNRRVPKIHKVEGPGEKPHVEPKQKVVEKPAATGTGDIPTEGRTPLPPERPSEFQHPHRPERPKPAQDDEAHKPHGDMPPAGSRTEPAAKPELKQPPERVEKPEEKESYGASPGDKLDRTRFYQHQMNGWSCSATALAMMHANEETGHPPSPGDLEHFERVTGTTQHGYRGSLADMANQARSQGMEAKAYQYGRFDKQGMNDLDRELAMGHSAVARIINPHTGHPHYIYVAGRDHNGNYIIGDPDRFNNAKFGHDKPVSRDHLYQMMSGRDGFVAGWS
jgi:hypothetical protein